MDERFRKAEREWLATGSPEAEERFIHEAARFGLRFRNHDRGEVLTEWEEIQADYDETWWHAKSARCWWWWEVPRAMGYLVKAHHTWGHRWGGENSKRKTLRTHRNTKKKARNYRTREKRGIRSEPLKPHEKRRMKRFAGRERLYGFESRYVWDAEQARYRRQTVVWYRVPLDE